MKKLLFISVMVAVFISPIACMINNENQNYSEIIAGFEEDDSDEEVVVMSHGELLIFAVSVIIEFNLNYLSKRNKNLSTLIDLSVKMLQLLQNKSVLIEFEEDGELVVRGLIITQEDIDFFVNRKIKLGIKKSACRKRIQQAWPCFTAYVDLLDESDSLITQTSDFTDILDQIKQTITIFERDFKEVLEYTK